MNLVEFLGGILTIITSFWTTLASGGGRIIVFTAAGVMVVGYAISGLWRMFSKKRGGKKG